jgi:hypothetical protein
MKKFISISLILSILFCSSLLFGQTSTIISYKGTSVVSDLPTTNLLRDYDPESIVTAVSGVAEPQGSVWVNSDNPGTGDLTWSNAGGGSDCAYIWYDNAVESTYDAVLQSWGAPWGSGCVFGTGNKAFGTLLPDANATGWHVFLPIKRNAGSGQLFLSDNNGLTVGVDSSGYLNVQHNGGGTTYLTATLPVSQIRYQLWSVSFNNATNTTRIWLNGVLNAENTGLSLGFTPNKGWSQIVESVGLYYARIAIYSGEQSGSNLNDIHTYLSKYLPTLPSSPPATNMLARYKSTSGVYEDAGTDPAENTDSVRQWNEMNGAGATFNLVQATAANQPVYQSSDWNGKPSIRLDATNDGMTQTGLNMTTPYEIWVIYEWNGNGNAGRRMIQGSVSNWLYGPYGAQHQLYAGGFVSAGGAVANLPVVARINGVVGGHGLYINTSFKGGGGGPTSLGVFSLGATGAFGEPGDGDIYEMIFYSSQTAGEISNTWLYFANEYGL